MTAPANLQEEAEQALRNGNPIIFSRRTWAQRLLIIPYEVAFLAFAIFCGVASLLHYGGTNTMFAMAIPQSPLYNILLIFGALATGVGAAKRRYNIEAAGLVILLAQLLIRAIVLSPNLDGSATNSIVLWVLMAVACAVRLKGILTKARHQHLEVVIQ